MGTVIIGTRPTFSSVPALAQGRHSEAAHIRGQEKWAANCVRHIASGAGKIELLLLLRAPFLWSLPEQAAPAVLAPTNPTNLYSILITCQGFLIMYITVQGWHNQMPFLLLRRVWARSSLMCSHFLQLGIKAWGQMYWKTQEILTSSVFLKELHMEARTHVCVITQQERAHCWQQLCQQGNKLSFMAVNPSSGESTASQQPSPSDGCHSSEVVSAAPLPSGLCQVPRHQGNTLTSLTCTNPPVNWGSTEISSLSVSCTIPYC